MSDPLRDVIRDVVESQNWWIDNSHLECCGYRQDDAEALTDAIYEKVRQLQAEEDDLHETMLAMWPLQAESISTMFSNDPPRDQEQQAR